MIFALCTNMNQERTFARRRHVAKTAHWTNVTPNVNKWKQILQKCYQLLGVSQVSQQLMDSSQQKKKSGKCSEIYLLWNLQYVYHRTSRDITEQVDSQEIWMFEMEMVNRFQARTHPSLPARACRRPEVTMLSVMWW